MSDIDQASNLLYEVSAWLHDVDTGEADFRDMFDALFDRLIPAADAMIKEARGLVAASSGLPGESRKDPTE